MFKEPSIPKSRWVICPFIDSIWHFILSDNKRHLIWSVNKAIRMIRHRFLLIEKRAEKHKLGRRHGGTHLTVENPQTYAKKSGYPLYGGGVVHVVIRIPESRSRVRDTHT